MPSGLDIDHKTIISNNIAPYTSHVLISTGQSDWPSRIENAAKDTTTWPWGALTSHLKAAFGRKGQYHSDDQNVLITTSSLPAPHGRSVLLFPANREISIPLPTTSPGLTDSTDPNADPNLASLLDYIASYSSSPATSPAVSSTPLTHPTILICSHKSRDTRCGVLGPLLASEFARQLPAHLRPKDNSTSPDGIRVAMISHVGGHKWAGNVIVYIPPGWPRSAAAPEGSEVPAEAATDGDTAESPLAGMGVWYGRVEPRHVEGIVRQTVLGGKVIQDLCRGVVDQNGRMTRI